MRLSVFDDSYINKRDDVDDTELRQLEKEVKDAGLKEDEEIDVSKPAPASFNIQSGALLPEVIELPEIITSNTT